MMTTPQHREVATRVQKVRMRSRQMYMQQRMSRGL